MRPPVAAALAAALLAAACGYPEPGGSAGPVAGTQVSQPSALPGADDFREGAGRTPVKYPDGLQVLDLKPGQGPPLASGATAKVHYTGWLDNGKKFDSSRDRGQPFDVTLGQHQVIAGWDEGVPGMREGGRRRLVIPAALGYGEKGSPPTIPANATLVFTIELVAITSPGPPASSPGT